MRNIIKSLSGIFWYKNYAATTEFRWIALLVAIIPVTGIIGNLPFSEFETYVVYAGLAGYCLLKRTTVNAPLVLMILVGALSIVANNPDPLFRSWERLLLWAVLLIAVTPVLDSAKIAKLRFSILNYTLIICVAVAVLSLFCYFLGINYMILTFRSVELDTIGGFGGLTRHSMMLGPISAVSMVSLLWYLLFKAKDGKVRLFVVAAMICAMCSMFLSSSRGASLSGIIGCLAMVFARYHRNMSKVVNAMFALCIAMMALFPVYYPFLEKTLAKQERNVQNGSSFHSRESRWDNRMEEIKKYPMLGVGFSAMDTTISFEYNSKTGVCEPGSSWLAVMSMTGILGMIVVLYNCLMTFFRMFKMARWSCTATLLIGLLSLFYVHLIIEGYIFAGGSYLCFLFWLIFGCAYSYGKRMINNG